MTKQEHIEYWKESAERNWPSVERLFEGEQFVDCLFWAHLVIEKLIKAHWVKDNKLNHPPRTHALVYLIEQTELRLNETIRSQLKSLEDYQLEGRYPDYRFKIYKLCNQEICRAMLEKVAGLRLWLLSELP